MKNVLIFGGNGFIGSKTTAQLLKAPDLNITVVNRGKSWDDETKKTIQPHVKCITHNRDKDIRECKELVDLAETKTIDYIIDFSGYEKHQVKDTVKLFAGKVGLYIYISTDSVYEVCKQKYEGPSRESDDERPDDQDERKKRKRKDSYGHEKLECEELLREQKEIAYVILRLADVIGAVDSTGRWCFLQTWVQAAVKTQLPVYVKQSLCDSKISLTYVEDVARVIVDIVSEKINRSSVQRQCFNLACAEMWTLREFIQKLAHLTHDQDVKIECSQDDDTVVLYPSVLRGPVDISKAIKLIQFKPTPLDEACRDIVQKYTALLKGSNFRREVEDVYDDMVDDLEDIYVEDLFGKLKDEIKVIMHL